MAANRESNPEADADFALGGVADVIQTLLDGGASPSTPSPDDGITTPLNVADMMPPAPRAVVRPMMLEQRLGRPAAKFPVYNARKERFLRVISPRNERESYDLELYATGVWRSLDFLVQLRRR
jgi:hypothetical protein